MSNSVHVNIASKQFAKVNIFKPILSRPWVDVRDFGAKGDGIADDAPAIQAAINSVYADQSVPPPSNPTRRGGIVFFPPGIYLCKSTLIFHPYITYLGIRSTVGDVSPYWASRGTIIKAHTDIYNNNHETDGVLIYLWVGDVTIRNIHFFGTATEVANPSIGLQWGSSGGTANTGRPHEFDGTGGGVHGVLLDGLQFTGFTKAWEVNEATIACHNTIFESSTVTIALRGNVYVNPSDCWLDFSDCLFWSSVQAFDCSSLGNNNYRIKINGGTFYHDTNNCTHIVYGGTTAPPNLQLECHGTRFEHHGSSGLYHVDLVGNYDGGNFRWLFDSCYFENGNIRLVRAGGSSACENWHFVNCHFQNISISLNIAYKGEFIGGVYDNSIFSIATATNWRIEKGIFRNISGTAITTTTPCSGFSIQDNYFESTVGAPLSIYAGSSNYRIKDNIGNGIELPIYANNAAAIAGGLTAGAYYRTGADPDQICVVH